MEQSKEGDISSNWVIINPVEVAHEAALLINNGTADSDFDSDGISVISESSHVHDSNTDDEVCIDETVIDKTDNTLVESDEHKLTATVQDVEQIDDTTSSIDDVLISKEKWTFMDSELKLENDISSNSFYLNCLQEPVQELSENELGSLRSDVESDGMSITSECESAQGCIRKYDDEDKKLELASKIPVSIKKYLNNSVVMGMVILITSVLVGRYLVEPIEEDASVYKDANDVNEKLQKAGEYYGKYHPSSVLQYCTDQHKNDDIYMEINIKKCVKKMKSKINKTKYMNLEAELLKEKEANLRIKERYLEVKEKELLQKEKKLLEAELKLQETLEKRPEAVNNCERKRKYTKKIKNNHKHSKHLKTEEASTDDQLDYDKNKVHETSSYEKKPNKYKLKDNSENIKFKNFWNKKRKYADDVHDEELWKINNKIRKIVTHNQKEIDSAEMDSVLSGFDKININDENVKLKQTENFGTRSKEKFKNQDNTRNNRKTNNPEEDMFNNKYSHYSHKKGHKMKKPKKETLNKNEFIKNEANIYKNKYKYMKYKKNKHLEKIREAAKNMQWYIKYSPIKKNYQLVNISRSEFNSIMEEHKGNKTLNGQWFIDFHRARNEMRNREHESDWYFDRARYRKYKRDKAKWYFDWMTDREKIRYTYNQ